VQCVDDVGGYIVAIMTESSVHVSGVGSVDTRFVSIIVSPYLSAAHEHSLLIIHRLDQDKT
jgi:hypothetical protein